jgi:hypothetical protein
MRALVIVRAIGVTCSGLVAGIFVGHLASAPARSALTASSFVQHQLAVHVYYVWMMPALILTRTTFRSTDFKSSRRHLT